MGYVKWYLFLLPVEIYRVVTVTTQDGVLRMTVIRLWINLQAGVFVRVGGQTNRWFLSGFKL